MTSLIQRLEASSQPILWLDALAYTGRLFLRGDVPWLDAGRYVAWQRKGQALLRSDAVALPLEELSAAWANAHDELRGLMAAKRRAMHPLRTLLADAGFRAYVTALVGDLRVTFDDRTLSLVMPTPRTWLADAYRLAHGDGESFISDDDDAEAAATYIADFLRSFADSQVDVLLMQEVRAAAPVTLLAPDFVPIANLCAHYRWELGVRGSSFADAGAGSGVSFVVAPAPVASLIVAIDVPSEFWSGADLQEPGGHFLFSEIPATAEPERVLERVSLLRELTRRERA